MVPSGAVGCSFTQLCVVTRGAHVNHCHCSAHTFREPVRFVILLVCLLYLFLIHVWRVVCPIKRRVSDIQSFSKLCHTFRLTTL